MGSIVTATLLWPSHALPVHVESETEPETEPVESADARDVRIALEIMEFNAACPASMRRHLDIDGLSPRAGHWIAELDVKTAAKMLSAMRRSITAWDDHRDGIHRVPGVPPVELLPTYLKKTDVRLKGVPDVIAKLERLTRESFDD
jgi:hypothetical protein